MNIERNRPGGSLTPASARVRRVRELSGRSRRLKLGLTSVEGPQAVAELLAYRPAAVRDVFVLRGHHAELAARAGAVTRFVHEVDAGTARALGAAHQGILATASLAELNAGLAAATGGNMVVVLAATQDPGNAGTIVRLADAFGAAAVIQTRGGVDLLGPKVIRASAGSAFHLPQVQGFSFAEVADRLRADGYTLLAADSHRATALPTLGEVLAGRVAWVFGNEARGLDADQRARVDRRVSVPMWGRAESLNVAAAAAIALYESALARAATGPGATRTLGGGDARGEGPGRSR